MSYKISVTPTNLGAHTTNVQVSILMLVEHVSPGTDQPESRAVGHQYLLPMPSFIGKTLGGSMYTVEKR
eukprot:1160948-Pelagomonas_calceolata.AAC.11